MPNDFDPQMNEEPLLGAVPALEEETWDGMLDEAFLAPPGLVDHLVDTFDESGPADHEADGAIDPADAVVDEHVFDAAIFGGEGMTAADDADLDDDAIAGADLDDDAIDDPADDPLGDDPLGDPLAGLDGLDLDDVPTPEGDFGGELDGDFGGDDVLFD